MDWDEESDINWVEGSDTIDATVVDLVFPLMGASIPWDHGSLLYQAIVAIVPEWAEADGAMLRLGGIRDEGGKLRLPDGRGWLRFRLPMNVSPLLFSLAGVQLDLDGDVLTLGKPRGFALEPSEALIASMVTLPGCTDEDSFSVACLRWLGELHVEGVLSVGQELEVRIDDRVLSGYRTLVRGLSDDAAVLLLTHGMGDYQKTGLGVFRPARPGERP